MFSLSSQPVPIPDEQTTRRAFQPPPNDFSQVRNCHTIDTHEMKWSIGRGDAFVYKAAWNQSQVRSCLF